MSEIRDEDGLGNVVKKGWEYFPLSAQVFVGVVAFMSVVIGLSKMSEDSAQTYDKSVISASQRTLKEIKEKKKIAEGFRESDPVEALVQISGALGILSALRRIMTDADIEKLLGAKAPKLMHSMEDTRDSLVDMFEKDQE